MASNMAPKRDITPSVVLAKVESLLAISRELIASLRQSPREQPSGPPTEDPVQTLAAPPTVLRAQATKLGLIIVNKPLAPAAIHGIIDDLESRVVPTLVGNALTILSREDIYGAAFCTKVEGAVEDLLNAVILLAGDVQRVVKGNEGVQKDAVMVTVGKLFAASDEVVGISQQGVVKIATAAAKDVMDLLDDGVSELAEWRDKVIEDRLDDEDDPFDEYLPPGDEPADAEAPKPERPAKEAILPVVHEALRKADLVHKLYQALLKRRIRKLAIKPQPYASSQEEAVAVAQMGMVEKVMIQLRRGQDQVDDIAIAFYTFRLDAAAQLVDDLGETSRAIFELVVKPWDGADSDAFSTWLGQWKTLFDGGSPRVIQQPKSSLDSIVSGDAVEKLSIGGSRSANEHEKEAKDQP